MQLLFCRVLLHEFVQNDSQHLRVVPIVFFSKRFVKIRLYNSTDTATAWKNSRFNESERLHFHRVDNELIVVHAFPIRMLTSFSVDEIMLPMHRLLFKFDTTFYFCHLQGVNNNNDDSNYVRDWNLTMRTNCIYTIQYLSWKMRHTNPFGILIYKQIT